jgi:hypothetical protein
MNKSRHDETDDLDRIRDYLTLRGVHSEDVRLVLRCCTLEIDRRTTYHAIDGYEYAIDHMLDATGRLGYDICDVNQALGLSGDGLLAFALAAGDDPICLDIAERRVVMWLLEEGEYVSLSSSLESFIGMIISETV